MYVSIYLSIYPSMYLCIYLSIYPSYPMYLSNPILSFPFLSYPILSILSYPILSYPFLSSYLYCNQPINPIEITTRCHKAPRKIVGLCRVSWRCWTSWQILTRPKFGWQACLWGSQLQCQVIKQGPVGVMAPETPGWVMAHFTILQTRNREIPRPIDRL